VIKWVKRMVKMKDIKSKRLRISPMTAAQMQEMLRKPQSDAHMDEALNEMYKGCVNNPKDWFWYTNFRIFLLSDDTCIGGLCFKGSPKNGCVEIGYGIDETYRKSGYATEAVGAAAEWAFTFEGVYFVIAETEKDNEASIAVLKKNGFTLLGEGEEGIRWVKQKPDTNWMSIYMCLGLSCGVAIGSALNNIGIGISIGMGIGLALGSLLDNRDKTLREKYKKELK
jgi:Acetyltransferases, including N-acetylases of ribosomal proteins